MPWEVSVPWEISGEVGPYQRSGADAHGWIWELCRADEHRRVFVEVTGTAWAISNAAAAADDRGGSLPDDTKAAIATEGRSEVEEVLGEENPPRVVACSTGGCHALSSDELGETELDT